MTFINTNGMAFFGPGSEWFWAALQFTALAITFIAIYRQLRTARSSHSVEQVALYTRQFDEERMARYQLTILLALRDKVDIPLGAGVSVGNYFEGLASLGRSGHLDIKLLWRVFGLVTVRWWTVLEPFVQRQRVANGVSVFEDFEWLAGMLTSMDRRAGRKLAIDAVYVANWLVGGAIESLQDNVRVEEALRSVTIASPEGLDIAHSAPSARHPSPSHTAENEEQHQSD
jgi:hypothetical protein